MDFSFLDDWEEGAGPAEEEVGEGYRNIWVLAQLSAAGTPLPATLEALGQARQIADQIGVYVYGLLLGHDVQAAGEALVPYGADRVLVAEDPALAEYQPEVYVQVLADLIDHYRPEIVLLPGTSLGNDLAPRLAERLDTGLLSHCVRLDLDMSERLLLGTFPVLGGEMFHSAACPEARPQLATLQPGYFPLPYEDSYRSGDIQTVEIDLTGVEGRLTWLEGDAEFELPPTPLPKARVVVGAGRGLGDAEGFALAEQLAQALGGVAAGSRGAFDEGWIDEEQIVGVGGQTIAPEPYVACGLSGDIYHTFGLQPAGFVVAINTDAEAPIMKIANMAVVGDAREIMAAMVQALA